MSRVFEALMKAGEEKKPETKGLAEVVDNVHHETVSIESNPATPEWRLGKNGKAHNGHHAVPSIVPTTKSWRERIEELFFGWDLQRYTSFPIVALEEDSHD